MKKLILVTLFAFGTFLMAQSQVLQYAMFNAGTSTWNFGMEDDGGSPPVYELDIQPTDFRTGFINNFQFDLEWKTENQFGCGTNQVETGPINTTLPLVCPVPAFINYQIFPFGFGNWGLNMTFN